MKIAGQHIEITDDYLQITVREPYWGAYKQFGWPKGEWGISLSVDLIKKAKLHNRKIRVKLEDQTYETTPKKIYNFYEKADKKPNIKRKNTSLVCLPQRVYTPINHDKETL